MPIAYLDLKYDRRNTITSLYNDPFTITAEVDDCTIIITNVSDNTDHVFKISYDNGMTWTNLSVPHNDSVSITIDNQYSSIMLVKTDASKWMDNIRITSETGSEFSVSGNIMTLMDATQNITSVPVAYFNGLFSDAHDLIDASGLEFPAINVGVSGYTNMFARCYKLKKAPSILPATTISNNCYKYMFGDCFALTDPPILPATTLALDCYATMFLNCNSMTTPPALPATTLAQGCYFGMFGGCSSLTTAPVLPATTLAQGCYHQMFTNCSSLVTPPALPATTLAERCYYDMFSGCSSITTAPNLLASNMTEECYRSMFYNCTSLNFIRILATDTATDFITDWVHNVAPIGTFVKDQYATYQIDSDSGVPIGWTVVNEGEDLPVYYGVTVLLDPARGGIVTGNRTYIKDSTAIVTATPNSEYDFVGWYDEDNILLSENSSYSFVVTEHVILTAKFAVNTFYTVTLNSDDPDLDPILTGAGTYAAHDIVTISASNVTNYNFIGWVENEEYVSNNQIYSFELTRNITLSAVYEEILDYPHEYFTIEVLKNNCIIELDTTTYLNNGSIDIKINSGEWHTYDFNDVYIYGEQFNPFIHMKICDPNHMDDPNYELIFNRRDRVHFRRLKKETSQSNVIIPFTIKPSNEYKVYGNIASLNENHDDIINMTDSYYSGVNLNTMYRGSNELNSVLNECYPGLFGHPNLLGSSIYSYLVDATNLILPFNILNEYAYNGMFEGCVLLTSDKLPILNTTSLSQHCYAYMFAGCTSLTTAPTLPITTLASYCYQGMFAGCTSLTTAPTLPATTLADNCYQGMFRNCTSLTTALELPATTLALTCYAYMFAGCTSLTTAPALPATTIPQYVYGCYKGMFSDCTSLTTAPDLNINIPCSDCYKEMFKNCSSLSYIKCLATGSTSGIGNMSNKPNYATLDWVYGINNSGIFVKSANYNGWDTGNNGIPSGWTVQDYTE